MTTALPYFSPSSAQWTDDTGRLTPHAQRWLRDLVLRVGGTDAQTNDDLADSITEARSEALAWHLMTMGS